jgi:ATP-dependent DNA ligase
MMEEIPVGLYVFDLLELDFEDLRNEKLEIRRTQFKLFNNKRN